MDGGVNQFSFEGFDRQSRDKVEHLLGVLNEIASEPYLARRLCLHGGTAINLFALNAPRLSVDIDLNYIGSTDRQTMLKERVELEDALQDICSSAGYHVSAGGAEHSGRSFHLGYNGVLGRDQVKIDIDYLNRSPLLPPQPRTVRVAGGVSATFPVMADTELFAGKTKALLERVAVRDLYDISQIAKTTPSTVSPDGEAVLMRNVLLYYTVVAKPFPRPPKIASRFSGREAEMRSQLYPMLIPDDRPRLNDLIATAEEYLAEISTPVNQAGKEFVDLAADGEFRPDLLFSEHPDVLRAALNDPAAQWKMKNLANSTFASTPHRAISQSARDAHGPVWVAPHVRNGKKVDGYWRRGPQRYA